MTKIEMVDLKGQYLKIKDSIDAEMQKVIDSCSFINGTIVKTFETNLAKYLNVKHVISCGNGTDALQLSLMALGLKPNDEVITVDFTFAATSEAIALRKLKPVLVDVDYDNFNIDIESFKKAITNKTKAVIVVHLFGQCANMEAIKTIAKEHNIYIIEDTAQALGTDYIDKKGDTSKAGAIGDIGTTSFFPSKNLGCFGDGGAVFTNNDILAKKIRSLANHGMSKRYHYDHIGINSRLDSIQAAVLNVKLKHLDEYIDARKQAAEYYDSKLSVIKGVEIPKRTEYSSHSFHQYTLKITDKRDEVATKLREKGISCAVYYPIAIHSQKAYSKYNFDNNIFPNTNKLTETVLSLPIHTELSTEQQDYIVSSLIEILEKTYQFT